MKLLVFLARNSEFIKGRYVWNYFFNTLQFVRIEEKFLKIFINHNKYHFTLIFHLSSMINSK